MGDNWDRIYLGEWDCGSKTKKKMDSKKKHPFAITCRRCGSNSVVVSAFDYGDVELRCKSCGSSCNCGCYITDENDYSDC